MLKESYRVLKKGAKAAFSVWGRKTNCTFITFLPEILEKYGVTEEPEKYCNFHIDSSDKLINSAKSAGFEIAKTFYLPSYHPISSGEDMWHFYMSTPVKQDLEKFDSDTLDRIKTDVVEEYD
jgi:hypothetical protein